MAPRADHFLLSTRAVCEHSDLSCWATRAFFDKSDRSSSDDFFLLLQIDDAASARRSTNIETSLWIDFHGPCAVAMIIEGHMRCIDSTTTQHR